MPENQVGISSEILTFSNILNFQRYISTITRCAFPVLRMHDLHADLMLVMER